MFFDKLVVAYQVWIKQKGGTKYHVNYSYLTKASEE